MYKLSANDEAKDLQDQNLSSAYVPHTARKLCKFNFSELKQYKGTIFSNG